MLIRFRFQNHRSFRDETELSMVASKLRDNPTPLIENAVVEPGLLPAAAVYGPNASGKTNLFDALSYMRYVVRSSHRHWEAGAGVHRHPFKLSRRVEKEPSMFEVDILVDGIRYQYGFRLDDSQILEEWLYGYPKGHRQHWMTRDIDRDPVFEFGRKFKGENRTIENLTRENSLFLSAAAQADHDMVKPIYSWFSETVRSVSPGNVGSRIAYTVSMLEEDNNGWKTLIRDLIQSADLGIVGFDIEEQPEEEAEVLKKVQEALDSLEDVGLQLEPSPPQSVVFRHKAEGSPEGVELDFGAESSGTQVLFSLAGPLVWALSEGGLLFVDELDTSLHPILAHEVVERFQSPSTNPNRAQLLFNTQDTNLLSEELLRRDQIWFVEKDGTGGSHLYPLTDYHPRKDENLERGYLQGRYDAVPVLSSQSFLARIPKQEHD